MAKANGLTPYGYLKWVFEELPNAQCVEVIETLLTWNVKVTPPNIDGVAG
jgi:hypothetical protein|tara:strand:+ start:945 stop:1094 length:150 start_codon:yes stop_codon:yes gene_type:complete